MTTYTPLKAGMQVWKPVTDHPEFPKQVHEGDPYIFADKDVAERIAAAWNSYRIESGWVWYAKEFTLLPRRVTQAVIDHEDQLNLW